MEDLRQGIGPEELRDVNVTLLQSGELTPDELESAAFSMPFMADRRLVIVRGLLSRFERPRGPSGGAPREPLGPWNHLIEGFSGLPTTTELAFSDGPLTNSNPLLGKLKPLGEAHEYGLDFREISNWINRRAARHGLDIDRDGVALLETYVGRQPRILDSELRKLALYSGGRRVGRGDVVRMVAYVREANVFQMVDAVIEGRTGEGLRMARQITDADQSPGYVVTMIGRQVRLLLLAKDMRARRVPTNEMGQRLRLPNFAVTRTLNQERRLSLRRLRRMHRQLVEADLIMKTTSADDQLTLEMLIAELAVG